MTCCNEDCQQGDDRPARVAKVGRRYPDRSPLAGATSHRHLRELAKWWLIVTACLLALGAVSAMLPKSGAIDCRALAGHWHPDIPAHIRAKCMKEKA